MYSVNRSPLQFCHIQLLLTLLIHLKQVLSQYFDDLGVFKCLCSIILKLLLYVMKNCDSSWIHCNIEAIDTETWDVRRLFTRFDETGCHLELRLPWHGSAHLLCCTLMRNHIYMSWQRSSFQNAGDWMSHSRAAAIVVHCFVRWRLSAGLAPILLERFSLSERDTKSAVSMWTVQHCHKVWMINRAKSVVVLFRKEIMEMETIHFPQIC